MVVLGGGDWNMVYFGGSNIALQVHHYGHEGLCSWQQQQLRSMQVQTMRQMGYQFMGLVTSHFLGMAKRVYSIHAYGIGVPSQINGLNNKLPKQNTPNN